jgi:hypothetical protein
VISPVIFKNIAGIFMFSYSSWVIITKAILEVHVCWPLYQTQSNKLTRLGHYWWKGWRCVHCWQYYCVDVCVVSVMGGGVLSYWWMAQVSKYLLTDPRSWCTPKWFVLACGLGCMTVGHFGLLECRAPVIWRMKNMDSMFGHV